MNLINIGINPNIKKSPVLEKEIIVISSVHAVRATSFDHARVQPVAGAMRPFGRGLADRQGAGAALRTLGERLMDAWSRRVARAYAQARLADVTPADSRMLGELQAAASHQQA